MASERLDATIIDLFDDWAATAPNRFAAEWQGEMLTYAELRNASLHVSKALLSAGVLPRAKVPLLTQMSLEMLPAIIGILRIGACYVPMDVAAWSRSKIEAALREVSPPQAIVTHACQGLQLPVITINFQKAWLHSPVDDAHSLFAQLDVLRDGFRADDLAWIVFTSGTTGKPKGVMVFHRSVYSLTVSLGGDIARAHEEKGMRCLLAYSIAFDGCAGIFWMTLTKGGTLAMASPSTFPEVASTCELLNLSPSMLNTLDPSGPYDGVRYIVLGAEAPNVGVVRQWIRPGRKVINTYGPSETTVVISFGEMEPNEEPSFGEILPGVKVVLVDENLQECQNGEVMIAGPGLAAGYLNNPELTAKKFLLWNDQRFYRTGDFARRTEKGQLVWAGRADALVKNRGFLVNLETEVEPALLSFPPVRSAAAFMWRDRLVGCVQPATVDTKELREFMKTAFDSFIVPDELLALDDFPLNVNSKTDRQALKAKLDERISHNESLLDDMHQISPYDTLCLAFSKCLHVIFKDLDRDSSFSTLGGNSLTAIRLSNYLKKRGYLILVIQILRLDTIGLLEKSLKSLSNSDGPGQDDDPGSNPGEVPVTDLWRLIIDASLQNPINFAIIGTTKYIGDPRAVPTPSELHDAFVKSLSAHSVFQTRFDLTKYTLSDLGRLNLDWQEVSVKEAEFENTCLAMEEKAWLDQSEVTRSNIEVPYCHITCVSVPGRKALAYITRANHILTDVFSAAILSNDVERALAGEVVSQGPSIQAFAKFMHTYKRDNLAKAIRSFENMVKPLSATSVVQTPGPRAPPLRKTFDLIRLDFPTYISKSAIDASVQNQRITSSTIAYAAWALFLRKITGSDCVGFSISLSGRTIPWTSAPSLVGALLGRAPFCTQISAKTTVHEWLTEVHKTLLQVLEFDGLFHALPPSIMADPHTNTTQVQCLLNMPEPSTNWSYKDKQRHGYKLYWYVFQDRERVSTIFEIQSGQVDLDWAKEVGGIPARMLQGLVNASKETLVEDVLSSDTPTIQNKAPEQTVRDLGLGSNTLRETSRA